VTIDPVDNHEPLSVETLDGLVQHIDLVLGSATVPMTLRAPLEDVVETLIDHIAAIELAGAPLLLVDDEGPKLFGFGDDGEVVPWDDDGCAP
jgi:hypothetical protein